jgi:hypothetical protein
MGERMTTRTAQILPQRVQAEVKYLTLDRLFFALKTSNLAKTVVASQSFGANPANSSGKNGRQAFKAMRRGCA